MDLIKSIRDLVAAIRAQDWPAAITLTLALIQIILAGLSAPKLATPHVKTCAASVQGLSIEALADKLESTVANHDENVQGPLIDLLGPILAAAFQKLMALLLGL